MLIKEPGIHPDLSATYHTTRHTPTRALTQSGIKTLLTQTPLDFITPREKKSAEMAFGSVVHKIALGKGSAFAVSPYDDYRTKEAREWRDIQLLRGVIPIKPDAYDRAELAAANLRARIEQLCEGEHFETEVPFFWLENDTWCSGQMDVWCPALLLAIDAKVTKMVHGAAPAAILRNGWDYQHAWYRRGLEKIMPEYAGRIRFVNLLAFPEPPYLVRTITISEAWRDTAERECLRALRIFDRCTAENDWPGYPDDIETLDMPPWAMRERLEAEMADAD